MTFKSRRGLYRSRRGLYKSRRDLQIFLISDKFPRPPFFHVEGTKWPTEGSILITKSTILITESLFFVTVTSFQHTANSAHLWSLKAMGFPEDWANEKINSTFASRKCCESENGLP